MLSAFGNSGHTQSAFLTRLALIGAGTFARDAYVPSLLQLRERFDLVAIYSRTLRNANARAEEWESQTGVKPDCYTDVDRVLARDDVDAVAILVPISLLPEFILSALTAGKHVLSEKPIAPSTKAARHIYGLYQNYRDRVWMVAENWRYESAYRTAAEMVASGTVGDIQVCQFSLHLPVTPQNKYWKTSWRREWDFEGGWIIDGGVHHIAVLRSIVGEIQRVQAFTALHNPQLGTVDTLTSSIEFESGAVGTYSVSYAAESAWPPYLTLAGDKGSMRIQRGQIEISQDGNKRTVECPKFDGVTKELRAFADAIEFGHPHLNTPEEALRDLAVVEAMLDAARLGQALLPDYRFLEERRVRLPRPQW